MTEIQQLQRRLARAYREIQRLRSDTWQPLAIDMRYGLLRVSQQGQYLEIGANRVALPDGVAVCVLQAQEP